MALNTGTDHSSIDEMGNAIFDGGILTRGRLRVVGALKTRVSSVSDTSYTVTTSDHIVLMSTAAARTVTLPDATLADQLGRQIIVKDVANTTAAISVIGAAGNVENGTTSTINTALGAKRYVSDGTNWWAW